MQWQSPQLGLYCGQPCPSLPHLLHGVLRQPSVFMHKSSETGRIVSVVNCLWSLHSDSNFRYMKQELCMPYGEIMVLVANV